GSSPLAKWLAKESLGWLSFWNGELIEQGGFSPFDAVAVGYAALPELFGCRGLHGRVGSSVFLAPFRVGRDFAVSAPGQGRPVRYCDSVDATFKTILIDRLAAGDRS